MFKEKLKNKKNIFVTIIEYLLLILIVLIIKTYIVCIIYIPSSSMEPTFNSGDFAVAINLINKDKIEKGDIVYFKCAELDKDKFFIKRVIATGGDTVHIDNTGKVFVNNEYFYIEGVEEYNPSCQYFVVPEDTFFLMGDNRDNSYDSRFLLNPFISKEDIKGKALFKLNKNGISIYWYKKDIKKDQQELHTALVGLFLKS